MKDTLQKFNTEVVPLADEGINDIEIYYDCLRTLHTQAEKQYPTIRQTESLELHHLTFHY